MEETPDLDLTKKILNTPEEFRQAIHQCQMEGVKYLEVTEKLFKYLTRNQKTSYLTWGSPGVKVFVEGTRQKIEEVDNMGAEAHRDYVLKKGQANP